MASALALQVVGEPADVARSAWSSVEAEFAASDAALSRFRADSELTALNRAGLLGDALVVGRRLAVAIQAADRARRLTDGRFDPRVVELLEAWGYRGAALGPDAAAVDGLGSADRLADRPDRHRLRLRAPVDLGGIGKGLALRWAARRLAASGVSRFLVDAGGDIVVRGAAPDGGPWSIGLEDPSGAAEPRAVIAVHDGAVATSSIRRLRWTDGNGVERHHLVDPATAAPADGGLCAVTVLAADPAWAEVWSKALFVGGRGTIGPLARSRGLAAWWIAADGTLEMTPAARAHTTWVADEA